MNRPTLFIHVYMVIFLFKMAAAGDDDFTVVYSSIIEGAQPIPRDQDVFPTRNMHIHILMKRRGRKTRLANV